MSVRLSESYWPGDTSEAILEATLGDVLRHGAATAADRTALVDGSPDPASRRRWTYGELLSTAEQVARALLARFSPGERIAVWAPNCPEWVLLQHGISLAGMVLVSVNPNYRAAETAYVLRQSGVAGVFFTDAYRDNDQAAMLRTLQPKLPELREAMSFSAWDDFLAKADPAKELPAVTPDDPLQVQYTSGTTGFPKGALLNHRGVVNASRFVARRAGFPEGGVWINAMPMFHIAGCSVTEIGCLAQRGTFVLLPGFEPGLVLEAIESERGSITLAVPTILLALLEHPDRPKHDLSSLRTVMSGAAMVPAALVRLVKQTFGCDFTILFGQTELQGVITQTRLDDTPEDQSETVGQPLPQVEVKIADPRTGDVLPLGIPGEICARGYQTMLGYYDMPNESAATLRNDGWLHSGDLGVMDERGYITITGRLKDMIIRGGVNIYPREIEETLFDHPAVAEASVVGFPDETWGEIIAAVIRPTAPGQPPNPAELHDWCRARLAAYKTPAQWYFVDQYPMTPSGKVQKYVLREWIADGTI